MIWRIIRWVLSIIVHLLFIMETYIAVDNGLMRENSISSSIGTTITAVLVHQLLRLESKILNLSPRNTLLIRYLARFFPRQIFAFWFSKSETYLSIIKSTHQHIRSSSLPSPSPRTTSRPDWFLPPDSSQSHSRTFPPT
jgi:hypothetical protein